MKFEFGKSIIEKRFGSVDMLKFKNEKKINKEKKLSLSRNIKDTACKDSITEYCGADKLQELLMINKKKIFNSKETDVQKTEEENLDIFNGIDLSLSIPPRAPYENVTKDEYKKRETAVFNEWKKINYEFIFERNIEIWRQFWITCERSDVIVQIIDSRNPNFFINKDILKMYPTKKHVILSNKADLTSTKVEIEGFEIIYYSATRDIKNVIEFLNNLDFKSAGFIGYPNVGKSSTINGILNKKKVKVSQTPGKTKFIQTIQYSTNKILLDCPGLVFPKHSKTNLLLNGILNVDKIIDLKSSLYEVINFIGISKLSKYYNIEMINDKFPKGLSVEVSFINHLADHKSWSVSQCIKNIIKDLFCGNIQYDKIEEEYKINQNYDWDA
jgi:large subunit GTPase 1